MLLGETLKACRRQRKLTQSELRQRASLNILTIRNLENGQGTVPSLRRATTALRLRFAGQPRDQELGEWLRGVRRARGYSLASLAVAAMLTKPTIIQLERGRGNLRSLASLMNCLGLSTALALEENPCSGITLRGGDCVEVLPTMLAGSVDLIITSPPYNAGKEYERNLDWDAYLAFAEAWVSEVPRILTDEGSIWINLGYYKGKSGDAVPLTYLYYPILMRHGLSVVQEVVWHFEGGLPYKRRFSHRTERWIWAAKDPKRCTFDLDSVRDLELNRSKDTRNNPMGKNPTDYWYFDRVVGGQGAGSEKTAHPAQFPVAMIERIVRACSREGETVLDCFAGSASTGVAASRLGRRFIGIEKEARYLSIAETRLQASKLDNGKNQ